uniref:RAD54 homolog B n=1 Tax=Equus asinus TaxID=9793 RepID=A0A9L0ISA8_EQUAS
MMLVLLNMRRSAAPSQLQGNPFKKPKFIPPARSNPSLNEEITKLNPDIKLFEVATSKTFLQSQNDPRKCSLNLLPTEESAREINHGDNYRGKYCFEACAMATLGPHHTVQIWTRKHRLVPVPYR